MTTAEALIPDGSTAEDQPVVFGALPQDPQDGRRYLRNVVVPTLTPYLPARATATGVSTGTGVVIAPGGALHFLSVDNEGGWVAQRLVERGIAAFVLHYRLVPTPADPAEFAVLGERAMTDPAYLAAVGVAGRAPAAQDGAAAVRLVRDRAGEWGVDPDRVGMLGFSAGGFVTAVTALDAPPDARPSFVAPIYPAMWGDVVVPDPAPMFLAWSSDDELGDEIVGSALRLYNGWRRAGAQSRPTPTPPAVTGSASASAAPPPTGGSPTSAPGSTARSSEAVAVPNLRLCGHAPPRRASRTRACTALVPHGRGSRPSCPGRNFT